MLGFFGNFNKINCITCKLRDKCSKHEHYKKSCFKFELLLEFMRACPLFLTFSERVFLSNIKRKTAALLRRYVGTVFTFQILNDSPYRQKIV